jgi:hypothetical protein
MARNDRRKEQDPREIAGANVWHKPHPLGDDAKKYPQFCWKVERGGVKREGRVHKEDTGWKFCAMASKDVDAEIALLKKRGKFNSPGGQRKREEELEESYY